MKRKGTIIADDGSHRLELQVTFTSRNGLNRDEVNRCIDDALDAAFRAASAVSYTDFRPVNTRIVRR